MRAFSEILKTAQAMNASFNTAAIQTNQLFGYAVQAVFTGSSINGTIKLQGSCDKALDGPIPSSPTNWTDITGSSVTINAAGSELYNVSDVMYNWVRFVYTDGSSGSSNGVMTVTISGKGV